MSKDTVIAEAVAAYIAPEDILKADAVLERATSVNEEGTMVFDNTIIRDDLLTEYGTNWEEVERVQAVGAAVSAAVLSLGSRKSIGHISENKDCRRVAGVMPFGRNEIAYSFQSMAGETNTDGSPKNPVVSVIHRQYEHEAYRDIRKNVMLSAKSLRD